TFAGQLNERSYVIELPALNKATKVSIDGTRAEAAYVDAESLIRVTVPARSIRQECTVTVTADEVDPERFKLRAFARRAGLETPEANAKLNDLLAKALGDSQDKAYSTAI